MHARVPMVSLLVDAHREPDDLTGQEDHEGHLG